MDECDLNLNPWQSLLVESVEFASWVNDGCLGPVLVTVGRGSDTNGRRGLGGDAAAAVATTQVRQAFWKILKAISGHVELFLWRCANCDATVVSGRICSAERFRAHSEFKSWNKLLNIFSLDLFHSTFRFPKSAVGGVLRMELAWFTPGSTGPARSRGLRAFQVVSEDGKSPNKHARKMWRTAEMFENVNLRIFHWLVHPGSASWVSSLNCWSLEVQLRHGNAILWSSQSLGLRHIHTDWIHVVFWTSIPRLVWDQQSCRGRSPTPCGGTSLGGGWSKMKWIKLISWYLQRCYKILQVVDFMISWCWY